MLSLLFVKFSTEIFIWPIEFFIFRIIQILFSFISSIFLLNSVFTSDIDFHISLRCFVFLFFVLFELFEYSYNHFESFVLMFFQVIFITMGLLIFGGDILSWVFTLFLFLHWHFTCGISFWECGLGVMVWGLLLSEPGTRKTMEIRQGGQEVSEPLLVSTRRQMKRGKVGPLSQAQCALTHLKWKLGRLKCRRDFLLKI